MPNSKSSDLRIKVIDRCLSDRNRDYSTAEMFELCNRELERRDFQPITAMNTIRNDIEQIERIYPGAAVEHYREGRNVYYRYADPDFSIYRSLLKPDETVQLIQTLSLLKRFRGMPQFDWITEIADRLGASLKIDEVPTEEVVGFDENLDLKGMEHFTPLFNAIIDKFKDHRIPLEGLGRCSIVMFFSLIDIVTLLHEKHGDNAKDENGKCDRNIL